GGRKAKFFEILVLALLQNSEIEVRPCGKAGAANKADGLADFHVLAVAHKHARQMQIHRLVTVPMRDLHDVAFAALAARTYHLATPNRLHGSADGSAVVRTHVRAIGLQNG